MKITMIGHSTVLIETDGTVLLTDPYLSDFNPMFKWLAPPAISKLDPEKIDGLLISHAHFDHCDRSILRNLRKDCTIVSAPTIILGGRFPKWLKPWSSIEIRGIKVTATPAVHPAPSVGFVIEAEGRSVYFAGDTFYNGFFQEIKNRYHLDAALIPVTTFKIPMTMGEDSAVRASNVLEPRMVIPIHRGITPRLPLLRTNQSAEGFREKLRASGNRAEVCILENGETVEF